MVTAGDGAEIRTGGGGGGCGALATTGGLFADYESDEMTISCFTALSDGGFDSNFIGEGDGST